VIGSLVSGPTGRKNLTRHRLRELKLQTQAREIPAKIYSVTFVKERLSVEGDMEVLEIKRELETLSERLGKTQDYL
jgi:hypothetical protein